MDQIIAILSDGAAVMKKLAEILEIEQQLCLAHGNHLAIVGVAYTNLKKKEKPSDEFPVENDENHDANEEEEESDNNDADESEEDDSPEGPEVQIVVEEEELELIDAIKYLIERVRFHVNKIIGAPVLEYELQEAVKKWQRKNGVKVQELVSKSLSVPTNQMTGRY